MRSCRDGVVGTLVLISDIGDVHRSFIDVDVVIDVRDLCAIDDPGVGNIDAFDVPFADVIRRRINVTRAEREPRHSNPNSCAAANPRHERWRINWTHVLSRDIGGTRR